jgi:hypothetical protein
MDLDVLLCDHAQVAEGKLFVSGAGIDRMGVPAGSPPPYVANFAVGGVVRVPWTATNSEHTLTFRFVSVDGQNPRKTDGLDPGPAGISGEMRFNVGRPPQLADGQEQMVPFGFNFQGLALMEAGRYELVLALDGAGVRQLGFTITVEPPTGYMARPTS